MRTWIIALLLYAVAALGGDRGTEPSYQFAERVVATAERSSPFETTEQSQSASARECCKVCTKGKPCGDTCIEKDDVCHVPPGCAC
jgi:hypothetical protein